MVDNIRIDVFHLINMNAFAGWVYKKVLWRQEVGYVIKWGEAMRCRIIKPRQGDT